MITIEKKKELIDEFIDKLDKEFNSIVEEISTRKVFYNSTFRKYLRKIRPASDKTIKFCFDSDVKEHYQEKLLGIDYFNRAKLILGNISSTAVSVGFTEDDMKELLEDIRLFGFTYRSTLKILRELSKSDQDWKKYEFSIKENDTSDLTKGFIIL